MAAESIMLYIYDLTDIALMMKAIGFVSNGTGQMTKRYGIIYVDLDDEGNGTGNRYLKKSYNWYKTVIGSNGKDLGIE